MEGFPNALVEAMSCRLPAVFSNCMSGPAEILSDRFEDVVGKQEVLRERYGILIPVMDDQKNLDPNEITEEEKTTGGSSGRAADRGSEAAGAFQMCKGARRSV